MNDAHRRTQRSKKRPLANGQVSKLTAKEITARRNKKLASEHQTLARMCTKQVDLYAAATLGAKRFAIVDHHGEPVWYGAFFKNDFDFRGTQPSVDLAVAKKAVIVAERVRKALELKAIRLVLFVNAEWLCRANCVGAQGDDGKVGGKARALAEYARPRGVSVEVIHVSAKDNPARRHTVGTDFAALGNANLRSLATEIQRRP